MLFLGEVYPHENDRWNERIRLNGVSNVVAGLSKLLLGLPAKEALTLIQRLHTVHERHDAIRAKYPSVFSGLGKLKEPYTIELEPSAVSYALSSPHRVPLPKRDKVRTDLKRMEDMRGYFQSDPAHPVVCRHGHCA